MRSIHHATAGRTENNRLVRGSSGRFCPRPIIFGPPVDQYPENYSSIFVNSSFLDRKYKFIPVSSTSTQFPVLNNWGIEEENQFFKSLKGRANPGASVSLIFSNQNNNQLGDSALYQFDYLVSVSAPDNTINGEYKGSAQFKILLDTRGQWVIVNWEDIQTGNNRNWSELKGRLY